MPLLHFRFDAMPIFAMIFIGYAIARRYATLSLALPAADAIHAADY